MSGAWEYMRLVWEYSTNYATHPEGPPQWQRGYRIERPDEAAEEVPDTANWLEIVNRLGAEGWELVTQANWDSAIVAESHGWPNAGVPVLVWWIFKRPR